MGVSPGSITKTNVNYSQQHFAFFRVPTRTLRRCARRACLFQTRKLRDVAISLHAPYRPFAVGYFVPKAVSRASQDRPFVVNVLGAKTDL